MTEIHREFEPWLPFSLETTTGAPTASTAGPPMEVSGTTWSGTTSPPPWTSALPSMLLLYSSPNPSPSLRSRRSPSSLPTRAERCTTSSSKRTTAAPWRPLLSTASLPMSISSVILGMDSILAVTVYEPAGEEARRPLVKIPIWSPWLVVLTLKVFKYDF